MINDLPPRDAHPKESQDVTEVDIQSDTDFAGGGEDAPSRDLPVGVLSVSSPCGPGYTFMNTTRPELIPLSDRETAATPFESTVGRQHSSCSS